MFLSITSAALYPSSRPPIRAHPLSLHMAPSARRHVSPGSSATRHFVNLSNGAEALPLLEGADLPGEHVSFCRIQSSHCEAQDFNGVLTNLDHNLLMHLALGFDCRVYDFGSRGNWWAVEEGEGTVPGGAGSGCGVGNGDGSDGGDRGGDRGDDSALGDGSGNSGGAADGDRMVEVTSSGEVQSELLYVPRAVWWGLEWSRYALNSLWHLESRPPLLRGYNVEDLFCQKMYNIPKPLWKRLKYYRAYTAPGLREIRLRGFYAQTALDGNKEAYREFMLAHAARSATDDADAEVVPANFRVPMREYNPLTAKRVGEVKGQQ